VEINLAVDEWLTSIASRLLYGYLVTVDYGAEASELYGITGREQGTLRAFRRHQLVDDFLAHPGEQDLTTTIDWTFVMTRGERLGLETVEFARQDHFLLKAGLLEELEAIAAEAGSEAEKLRLRTSSREMILPDGMAARFQVLVQQKKLQPATIPVPEPAA
jgi:SAM-dependent MidA family methyltransferase